MRTTPADKVPITKSGNLVNPYDTEVHEWIEGGKFIATMCVDQTTHPNSRNVIILLKDVDRGTKYRILMLDYVKMMVACQNISHSIVHGLWEFVHVGRKTFAIRLLHQLK